MILRSLRRCVTVAVIMTALAAASLAWAQETDITISKSGPVEAPADSDVSYSVTVTNLGPDDAVGITLTDAVPAGMTFVSATPPGCSTPSPGFGGIITCTIASLTVGATANFTFVFHIPPGTPPGTFFTNVATAVTPTDPNDENNSGVWTTSTPPPPQADMGVTKTGPASAAPDTDVVYTIVVTNGGLNTASNVTLNDTLPGTMTFVSLTQTGTPMLCTTPPVGSGGLVTCTAGSYPSGGTTTLTLTGHIPSGTPSGTEFTNIATVSSPTTDPNLENNISQSFLIVSTVDISVTKTGPSTVVAGNTVTYTLTIANGGPDTANNVQLSDPLPPNTTFVSLTQDTGPVAVCSAPPPDGTGIVSCDFTVLTNGQSAQFTLVIRAGNTTAITNTVSATTDSFDTNPTNNTASAPTTTVTPSADVAATKNGPATVTAGQNVTYTVTVTNAGPSTAATVSLTDSLPPNTTFVSFNQTGGPTFTCNTPGVGGTGTITCGIATLAPGASATFSIMLRLAPSAPNGGSVSNTANVSTTTADPNTGNNASTTSATTAVSADVGLVKSGPDSVTAGSTVTYTVVVTNGGPSDASSVSLTDTLPPNTTFGSLNQTTGPSFTCLTPGPGGTGTITCTIATLASGAAATFSLVLNVSPSATGALSNTANVSTTTADPNGANNTSTKVTTVAVSADVSVTKSGPASVLSGSNVTYTVTVTNSGPSAATTVSLTDALPANTTFVSLNQTVGPGFTCLAPASGGTGTITCTIATFASGASATFSLVLNVAPTAAGDITNTASVSSTSADPASGNNSSTARTTVNPGPTDVGITKTASVDRSTLATSITYTIVVTNHGPAIASGVVATDVLPAGSTLSSATTTQGTCTGTSTVTCAIGTLPPGGSATITLVVTLPRTTGPISNTATVTAANSDTNPDNDSSTADVDLLAAIPTLSSFALALLALVLLVVGCLVLRARRPSAATP